MHKIEKRWYPAHYQYDEGVKRTDVNQVQGVPINMEI